MSACIAPKVVEDLIRKIATEKELDRYRGERIDIWKISDADVDTMLGNKNTNHISPELLDSKPIRSKLDSNLKYTNEKTNAFIKKLKKGGSLRHNALALDVILESVKGEVDKARGLDIEVSSLSSDGVTPYLPLHRMAATIGRKILYLEGYTVTNADPNVQASEEIEALNYDFGMKVVKELEAQGFLKIHEDGAKTIKDYLEDINDKRSFDAKDLVVTNNPAVSLNLDAFDLETDSKSKTEQDALKYLTDRATSDVDNHPMGEYVQVLKAVNLLSQPQYVSLPSPTPGKGKHDDDVGTDDPTFAKARKELNEQPLYIDEDLHGMYDLLNSSTDVSGDSASSQVRDLLQNNRALISALFKVDTSNEIVSQNESVKGRNLSSATPLDDLVEYWDAFKDKSQKIFFDMFRGRNGRLYVDNSVLNPHASKIMRHTMSVDPYTIKTGSDVHSFYVGKVAYVLGATPAEVLGQTKHKGLEKALTHLDRFTKAKTLAAKLASLSHMHDFAPSMDFAELVTTLKAAKGIQDGVGSPEITSTYAVSSDATASGGMLTLLQALGTNPLVKELLQDLGIIKGKTKSLPDVYQILRQKMDMYLNGEIDEEGINIKPDESKPGQAQQVMKLAQKTLFKDVRDMAKKPTMTFIYGQSRKGANVGISEDMAERTLKQLDAHNPAAIEIINAVLDTEHTTKDFDTLMADPKLKANLIGGFGNSGAPGLMYDMLTGALTSKYLKPYQDRSTAVMRLLARYPKLQKMKVLPASAAIEFGKPASKSQLEKYGVPLQKIFEVRKDTYAPVLTREGKLQPTIMGVSLIHTADASILYRALGGLPTKHKKGVVVVHDDMRSSPELIMEAEKRYVEETLNYAQNYDIHEQVLLAAAQYSNSEGQNITQDPDYTKLLADINKTKAEKASALKEFDLETDSIIGDPIDAMPETTTESVPASTTTKPADTGNTLADIAGESDIISEFVVAANNSTVAREGDVAKFDPQADKITIPKNVSKAKAVELAEHEIVHSYTSAVVQDYYQNGKKGSPMDYTQSQADIAYIEKAVKKLQSLPAGKIAKVDPHLLYTISQIASSDTPTGVAELISVLSAEPKAAEAIYTLLAENQSGTLRKIIDRVVKRVREILRKVTPEDLEDANIDVGLLYSAVNSSVQAGKSMREQNIETTLELQKGFGDLYSRTADDNPRFAGNRYMDAINESVSRRLTDPAIRQSGRGLSRVDALLDQYFPAYSIVRKKIAGVYESSSELQQLVHTLSNEDANKAAKNEVLSAFSKIRAEKNEITSNELTKFGLETSKLNSEQKKAFYDFVHRMPLHDFFTLAETVTDIDQEVDGMTTEFSKDQLSALDAIVNMRMKGETTPDTKYSVSQIFAPDGDMGVKARKYIVLKTISEIGVDKWNDFKSNDALFQHTKDVSLANAALNSNVENQMLSDTLVKDEAKEPKIIKAVKKEDMWKYSFEEKSGWKIQQKPDGRKPGIVYKTTIDQTHMEGAFTDAKYYSSDVDVGEDMRNMEGVVKTATGYKLVLNDKQKTDMGVFNDAEQGLVRSMTHAMALQDSQNIRDRLLQRDTFARLDQLKPGELEAQIKDKESDHPWFLGGDTAYEDLPKVVQNKYMPVGNRLSNVEGFNDKIDYVRKDIEHWLVGRTEKSLFNDPKLKWTTRIVKDLVALTKIGMVILNPMKIVGDNVSNIAYLGVRGVDPLYIQKQYRLISKEFHDYQQMKNKLNHLRVKGYAEPNKEATIKKQIAKLEGQLKDHPANGLVERGFINSLGSDLVLRAGDPASGLKSDMDNVLKALFKSKDEGNNHAAKLIMKLSNWNVGIEEFLEIFAKIPGAVDSTKNFEKEVNTIARRLKDVKSQDDVVSYMHQYLNSPDSEFVKMGTYMTDLTDVLSKETYYRYLTSRGMDPKKAEIEVIDSFPDYKENLPTRVKQMSDVGILMFPSYWLRIQRAIYRMVKEKPVNFATEMSIEAAMGTDVNTIWDANIVSKAAGNYGIFHTPWESMGTNSLFPTNVI